jgi:hypothetical protein
VTHGIVLPGDQTTRPRYVLEFDLAFGDAGRPITRFEGSLSRGNPGLLGDAAQLWQRYRTADVGEAVTAYELSTLERAIRDKFESPLAATVASLVLLRANRLDLLHDWVRNLAHFFPEVPDGPALWAEQVLRQQAPGALASAAEFLGLMADRGLPHTGEALGYAAVLVDRLSRLGDRVPALTRARLQRLAHRFDEALTWFRPAGLFASYVGFEPSRDPGELIGPIP